LLSSRTYSDEELSNMVDMKLSFYCGDAAGRIKPSTNPKYVNSSVKYKKDFSDGDRAFAFNVGVPFFTPEEIFLGAQASDFPHWEWKSYSLAHYFKAAGIQQQAPNPDNVFCGYQLSDKFEPSTTPELLLTVGAPACGKSRIAKELVKNHGYVQCNKDLLKTDKKIEQAVKAAVESGKPVILDNTNPAPDARAIWVKLAKSLKIPVRVINITTAKQVSMTLSQVRNCMTRGQVKTLPDIAIHTFFKKFSPAAEKEGFSKAFNASFAIVPWDEMKVEQQESLSALKEVSTLGQYSRFVSPKVFLEQIYAL